MPFVGMFPENRPNTGVSSMAKKKKTTKGRPKRPKKKKSGGNAGKPRSGRRVMESKPRTSSALLATSKSHAVAAAVAAQLTAEGRWPPNDLTKVMGTDYRYNQFTMGNFLAGVRARLASSVPPFTFSFDGAFTIQALSMTVAQLIVAINSRTR